MAVILNGFGTPEELRKPFGLIAAVCGFVGFGAVQLIREIVKKRNRVAIATLIFASGLIALVSLCVFWLVLEDCVFQAPRRTAVFFPLWLDGPARESVEKAGGRKAYYETYGAGAVSSLLDSQTEELNRTKLLLLVLISAASISLAVASGLASAFPNRRPGAGSSSGGTSQVPRKAPSKRGSPGGSGANLLSMYLSGERPCRFKRPGPRSKFSERWLLVRLVV
jgi:hypothetical protein